MNIVNLAQQIAREAHEGQERWGGGSYIIHPEAVAREFVGDDCKIVAWLHDVIEDTEVTLQDLLDKGIPQRFVDAVNCITKKKTEDYIKYILQIKDDDDELARMVKIADLKHNLSDLKQGSMRDKYMLTLYILEGKQ